MSTQYWSSSTILRTPRRWPSMVARRFRICFLSACMESLIPSPWAGGNIDTIATVRFACLFPRTPRVTIQPRIAPEDKRHQKERACPTASEPVRRSHTQHLAQDVPEHGHARDDKGDRAQFEDRSPTKVPIDESSEQLSGKHGHLSLFERELVTEQEIRVAGSLGTQPQVQLVKRVGGADVAGERQHWSG